MWEREREMGKHKKGRSGKEKWGDIYSEVEREREMGRHKERGGEGKRNEET